MEDNLPIRETQGEMEKIVALCKRRGFIYPGSEIYGGLANSWDFGPLGVELKNNIKQAWWKRFVSSRSDIVGIDASIIMNTRVWEASGHLQNFTDPLIECRNCHTRFRPSVSLSPSAKKQGFKISAEGHKCPNCGSEELEEPKDFNLMFKTHIGSTEESSNTVFLRPETAQAMFVDFKNVLDSFRVKIPFGLAQIGKAFRNEVTPGNFIFRTREFEQMEIEYFIPPPKKDKEWQDQFDLWKKNILDWIKQDLKISLDKVHELEVPKSELAHYSKKTIDFEYDFPFGREELYGLAYRGDFDMRNHEENSGQNLKYRDPDTGDEYWPHVIEPTWGVERSVLAVLVDGYSEEENRIILKLNPKLAPYKVAVFPLLANKPDLVEKASSIYHELLPHFPTAWDDRGNIGKRYLSQDEAGTPWCVTVDFQTLEDDTVTVRDRDTAEQERIKISELQNHFFQKLK